MFYNTKIEILKSEQGIVDDYGIYQDGDESVVDTIYGDLQPYSSDLVYKDYGYRVECTNRIYCDPNDYITAGSSLNINSKKFKVTKMIVWDTYMEVMVMSNE